MRCSRQALTQRGRMYQWAAMDFCRVRVVGSIPIASTNQKGAIMSLKIVEASRVRDIIILSRAIMTRCAAD